MKRYLILGHWHESNGEKRRAARDKSFHPDKNFYPIGEGRLLSGGEREGGGFYIVAECEAPVEDYLADLISQADVEITPIVHCPKECNFCPPWVVPVLRKET